MVVVASTISCRFSMRPSKYAQPPAQYHNNIVAEVLYSEAYDVCLVDCRDNSVMSSGAFFDKGLLCSLVAQRCCTVSSHSVVAERCCTTLSPMVLIWIVVWYQLINKLKMPCPVFRPGMFLRATICGFDRDNGTYQLL
jgi:hypothetical protein